MKKALALATFFVITIMQTAIAATPQVKNVRAMQQYPWGKVYITYEVVGDIVAGSGKTPFLVVKAQDKTTGEIYGHVAVGDSCLSGDTGTAAGLHKVVWNIGEQGVALDSTNVIFIVSYYDEEYLVVDLSAGANATSYPVTYLDSPPSGGFNVDTYKTTKLVLRRLEAGTFKMQNSTNVKLTKPFFCGMFEVTQRQYELVTGSNPSTSLTYYNTYPVYSVSYNMIRGNSKGAQWPSSSQVDESSFLGKLRARTGLQFDLPTEAQWEYACRAGTTTTYYWGNSMDESYAWYQYNSGSATHPVGNTTPNAWRLYDMSGNVEEWCLDWYATLSYGTNPKGSSSGSSRVLRGGSWNAPADSCTSSCRDRDSPSYGGGKYGFRVTITCQ